MLNIGLVTVFGFSMGRVSATFWDKGTEVPSLSRDKGTTGQAQNLAMGRDGLGQFVKIREGTRDMCLNWKHEEYLEDKGSGYRVASKGFYDYLLSKLVPFSLWRHSSEKKHHVCGVGVSC